MKNSKISNSIIKLSFLFLGVLVMFFRAPSFFFEPRFWGEEGIIYFSNAFNNPWYKALFTPHLGYFSLFNNIASMLAANIVQLKYAPLITTLLAFVVQVIPLAIVLWSQTELWGSAFKKAVGILIILFVPLSGEIWLATNCSQFYFSLITFLILMEDMGNASLRRVWCYRILLVLSGLTGVVSCFLTPLFIFKVWTKKRRENIIQASILVICSMLQFLVFWISIKSNAGIGGARFAGIDLSTVIAIIWTKTIILPIFGPGNTDSFAVVINRVRSLGSHEFRVFGFVLFLFGVAFFRYVSLKVEPKKILIILLSYFLITTLSILSSIGDKSALISAVWGARYFYVPNVILMILILSNLELDKNAFKSTRFVVCAALLSISLTFGAMHYKKTLFVCDDWPKWSKEVVKWEQDPEYELKVWPQWDPGWKMTLKKR
jgi:hypothetical protein